MRLLELYSGIGGCAVALGSAVETVGAIDVNRVAASVYEANLSGAVTIADLRSVSAERLRSYGADLWWLSPPCQPFTRRGRQRDVDDPRCESFLRLLPQIEAVRPAAIGLENVAGFQGSEAERRLRQVLERVGYRYRSQLICPHALGIPNRRERYYLVASRDGLDAATAASSAAPRRRLGEFVDSRLDAATELQLAPEVAAAYGGVLDCVDRSDPDAVAATFTSAYGRSHVRSGSYLRTSTGLRRFAPKEILALLGFPPEYRLPEPLTLQKAWSLVGNSLSLPAVRQALNPLFGGTLPP